VWSYCGERIFFSLNLSDTRANRTIAEMKARMIERDIANDLFDPTLEKYRGEYQGKASKEMAATTVFERYTEYKAKTLRKRSLEKYHHTLGFLEQYFQDDPVTEAKAEGFREWMGRRLEPITLKQRISLLKSAWVWGIEKGFVEENPWVEVLRQVKVQPKQKQKPFTKEERKRIIAAFRQSRYYSYYADFVEFLLATGCRPGEACALRWKHFTDDLKLVWVGEAYSRGELGPTKTTEARFLKLTDRLIELLRSRQKPDFKPDDLVFPACEGGFIDDHNFRNRAWKKTLDKIGIDYRKPYNMRHTFTSAALDSGLSPATVASLTGHTVETLYQHYAGNVNGLVDLPEI
jgi:integrase